MSANNPGLLERQCRVLQCSKTANLLFTIKQYIVGRTNRRSWGTPLYSTEMRVRFASHPQQPCDSRGVSANEDSFLKSSLSVAASRKRASIPGVCTRAPADILIKFAHYCTHHPLHVMFGRYQNILLHVLPLFQVPAFSFHAPSARCDEDACNKYLIRLEHENRTT